MWFSSAMRRAKPSMDPNDKGKVFMSDSVQNWKINAWNLKLWPKSCVFFGETSQWSDKDGNNRKRRGKNLELARDVAEQRSRRSRESRQSTRKKCGCVERIGRSIVQRAKARRGCASWMLDTKQATVWTRWSANHQKFTVFWTLSSPTSLPRLRTCSWPQEEEEIIK